MPSRLLYRTRQFLNALPGTRTPVKTEALLPHLSPTQITLFRRMQRSEQFHALQVFNLLKDAGQTDPDLLSAGLLHDVGKVMFPLSLFDRMLVVLGKAFFPRQTVRWSEGAPNRLHRPFVVAARHPEWGADLARQAGVSPRTVELIRRHQDMLPGDDQDLAALQAADDKN
jgi:HD-like signal output (HDOD) protein